MFQRPTMISKWNKEFQHDRHHCTNLLRYILHWGKWKSLRTYRFEMFFLAAVETFFEVAFHRVQYLSMSRHVGRQYQSCCALKWNGAEWDHCLRSLITHLIHLGEFQFNCKHNVGCDVPTNQLSLTWDWTNVLCCLTVALIANHCLLHAVFLRLAASFATVCSKRFTSRLSIIHITLGPTDNGSQ